MDEWNSLNPKKPSVVSVTTGGGDGGDASTVSTITHAPDTPVRCALVCALVIIKQPIHLPLTFFALST